MQFIENVNRIKKEKENILCIFRLGNFFVAFGRDACFLEAYTGVRRICFTPSICKCGFPVTSLDKYITVFTKLSISFCIYDYREAESEDKYEFEYNGKRYNKVFEYLGEVKVDGDYSWDCQRCRYKKKQLNDKLSRLRSEIKLLEYDVIEYNKKMEDYDKYISKGVKKIWR